MSPSLAAWMLHSPRRFTVIVVAAVTTIALAGWLVARGASSPADVQRSASTAAHSAGGPDSTPITEPSGAHEERVLGPDGRRTLERFLAGYLAPTTREKLTRLRPLTTAQLWAGLAVADPKNMPGGPVKATRVESEGAYSSAYVVQLRDASIKVDVVAGPDGPRVASVEPVQP